MGEWSKSIGEAGEDIADLFLEKIGWMHPQRGIDVKCVKPDEHSDDGKKKRSHGIDKLFAYKDPMTNRQLTHVVVSVKASMDRYPNSPAAKFKEYFTSLAASAECYRHSEVRASVSKKYLGVERAGYAGVLCWFSLSPDQQQTSIVAAISNCRVPETSCNIFVIDNRQASFLYDAITHVENKHRGIKPQFFYFNNGRNYDQFSRLAWGQVLPVEYLNAAMLPLVVELPDGKVEFVLATSEPFSEEAVQRIMGLAKEITQKLSSAISIVFPDYETTIHQNTVRDVKASFLDANFTGKCSVGSFVSDFRKL